MNYQYIGSGAARLLWIEISSVIRSLINNSCQEPQGSCGLKCLEVVSTAGAIEGQEPQGSCGLKF